MGMAELHGYKLKWHKRSSDGSGKCDVVETDSAGAVVFGVLFRIAAAEKPALDRAEGVGRGYDEKLATVIWNGESRNSTTYSAAARDESLRPYTWYRALVVAGAREHCLPAGYVARLEDAEAIEDPNRERHARHMAMVSNRQGEAER